MAFAAVGYWCQVSASVGDFHGCGSVLWHCQSGSRRGIRPPEILVPIVPTGSIPEQVEEEIWWDNQPVQYQLKTVVKNGSAGDGGSWFICKHKHQ